MVVAYHQDKETMDLAGTRAWTSVSRNEKMNGHSLRKLPGMPSHGCSGHSAEAVLYDGNCLPIWSLLSEEGHEQQYC